MNDLTEVKYQFPDTLPDLAKFALIGREKLNAVRAEIRAIEKVGLAKEVHEQKLKEAQEIAEAVLDAEMKIGELTERMSTTQGQRTDLKLCPTAGEKSKNEQLKEIGISHAERFEKLAKHPEAVEKAKAIARENGDIVSRQSVMRIIAADAPKPPKPPSNAYEAKQRHAEYEEKKQQGVVNIQDARQDKEDKRKIAEDLYKDLLSITTKGYWIGALNSLSSIELLKDVVTDKGNLIDRIGKLIDVLQEIREVLSS